MNKKSAHTKRAPKQKESQELPLHTPGPWLVDPTGDLGPWLVGTRETPVAEVLPEDDDVQWQANARLIAAAPDLLAACERVLPVLEVDDGDADGLICCELTNGDVRAIRNAVIKATSVHSA